MPKKQPIPANPVPPKEDEKHIQEELEKMDYPDKEDIMNPASGAVKAPHSIHENHEGPGDDLDVPGSDLDDDMEDIGEEDEENNYYSLGGEKKD